MRRMALYASHALIPRGQAPMHVDKSFAQKLEISVLLGAQAPSEAGKAKSRASCCLRC